MKISYKILFFLLFVIFIKCSSTKEIQKTRIDKVEIKTRKVFASNLSQFILNSEKKLNDKYHPITEKTIIAPSGDKHDYISRAVYYWPNPSAKDSLPWVYRDGKYNFSSLNSTDHSNYYNVLNAIKDFSFSFYLTKNEVFAEKAFELINMWFIDDKTKMNPNLEFAQGIPGKLTGTPSGIIDGRIILWVANAFKFLRGSNYYQPIKEEKFKEWCHEFLIWLLNSDFGKIESKAKNNHSTFYALQISKFASFTGNDSIAISVLEDVKNKIIPIQIKQDGSMPLELERAEAFGYSVFNLNAFFHLAILAEKYNINLWNYKSAGSGSIKDAYDFLINNTITKQNWNYTGYVKKKQIIALTFLASIYIDDKYSKLFNDLVESENYYDPTNLYFVQ